MALRVRLTPEAAADIRTVLRTTRRLFGNVQLTTYARLIDGAIELVATDVERPGSIARPDLGDGVRSLDVSVAARRRGAASHVIYYRAVAGELLVLRVLHDAMEPARRVANALRS